MSDATRVAAIDCGTNSIRLLIADLHRTDGLPRLVDYHREMRIVRLGEGVDATGNLTTGALDRTWRALSDYSAAIRQAGAVRVRMTATSATRDAGNAEAFIAMVRATLGQAPEIISGEEEAGLTFAGAVGELDPASGPFLVVDIGGGSTELAVGEGHGGRAGPRWARSLNIGSVRLTERILHGDPPTPTERETAGCWVRGELAAAVTAMPAPRRVVAVSGTCTTVAAAVLRLPRYEASAIHLSQIPADRIAAAAQKLLRAPRAERALAGYMHPGRVDVIGGGALILATLVDLVRQRFGIGDLTVSEHDILDGIALSLG